MFRLQVAIFRKFINKKGSEVQRLFQALIVLIFIIKLKSLQTLNSILHFNVDMHRIARRDPSGSCFGMTVHVHSPRSVNGCECGREEAHCCVVLFCRNVGLLLLICIIWSFDILRILILMTELRATSSYNKFWNYDPLLIYFLKMAPRCWNMYEGCPESIQLL